MLIKGPAAKQFINPRLRPTFSATIPRIGSSFTSLSGIEQIQGIVCLPGQQPQFLTAENIPIYRSLHGFKGEKDPIFTVGICPLEVTDIPDSFTTFGYHSELEANATPITVSHPFITEAHFQTSPTWQAAKDGGIWGGLFSSMNYRSNSLYLTRSFTLVRFNGQTWEIPFAQIVNGHTRTSFIEVKGIGLPYGVIGLTPDHGLITDSDAINSYAKSSIFHNYENTEDIEYIFRINVDHDREIGILFRTGLASTLRADAINWGEKYSVDLRHSTKKLLKALFRSIQRFSQLGTQQYDPHFQNLYESWYSIGDDEVDTALLPCDLGRVHKTPNSSSPLTMPLHALCNLLGSKVFTRALAEVLKEISPNNLFADHFLYELDYLAGGGYHKKTEDEFRAFLAKHAIFQ